MAQTIKERVLYLARQGVSYYEIERNFGVHHAVASKWARNAGIKRGRGCGCVAKNNAKRASDNAANRIDAVRNALEGRFDVVRETHRNLFVLKCTSCGHEFERFVDLRYPTTCPECQRREAERSRFEREDKRRELKEKRALMQRLVNILAYEHICPECGARFRSPNPSQLYCCDGCGKRARWKRREKSLGSHGSHVKRAKRYGVEYDRSITLNKLIRRDGMTCYICGKTCTKDDRRWGTFGPEYPTIDHVIPLCKGGTHTWDNVRIACGECNEAKGGSLP